MRIFLTGATGFIGEAIARELLAAGHQVLGLARSEAKAQALSQLGIESYLGDISDPQSLVAGARECDGVIHTAFNHDFFNVSREVAAETDRQVVEAFAGALEGSGKPLVIASGTAILTPGRVITESDTPPPNALRAASEQAVLSAAKRGVRASIVRLPPTVHGAGDHGFVPFLIDIARRTGVSAFVGDGENRWPAVHRLDVARLFRLALENAEPGAQLHGVAEESVPMRAIAETIGTGLGVPVRSLSPDEAATHFNWLAPFVAIDNPTSSAFTRDTMGWSPQEVGLLADMKESGYFSVSV